jgi:DNA-binding transcriptional LysR family regulator
VGRPAAWKTVAQLEDRLGVKLLVRSTRGLTPTEARLNFYTAKARAFIGFAEEVPDRSRVR